MLNRRTVLIVGAGASKELGFPTGPELIEQIAQLCRMPIDALGRRMGSEGFKNVLLTYAHLSGYDIREIYAVVDFMALKMSGSHKSIDQLIHTFNHRPYFADIAKLSIAFVISQKERENFGSEPSQPWAQSPWKKNNWIDTFTSNYLSGFQSYNLKDLYSDLAIVCFNYDRCIEYGFARALAFHLDLEDDIAIQSSEKLSVIHPYGDLGKLQKSRTAIDHSFGLASAESIVDKARHIKTFTEEMTDYGVQTAIANAMNQAETVVSLGFSYQATNVNLLRAVANRKKYFAGTTFKMSDSDATIGPKNLMQNLDAAPADVHAIANIEARQLLGSLQLLLFK